MRITVRNDGAGLKHLAAAVEAFARERGLSSSGAYAVRLVGEEITTNVVKYAYPDGRAGEMSLDLEATDGVVRLRLEDDGRPFDPNSVPPPDLAAPLETRRVGGLGLHLVHRYSESVSYRRVGDKNVLEVRVRV
jgi:anti-sigma regulatory factor (Ser/Thr protein kinase)